MQLPSAGGAQSFNHQLHLAPWLVNSNTRLGLHQLPVTGRKIQLLGSAAKQGAANLCAAVLEVEITMATAGFGKSRQLALHRDHGKACFQGIGNRFVQSADCPNIGGLVIVGHA